MIKVFRKLFNSFINAFLKVIDNRNIMLNFRRDLILNYERYNMNSMRIFNMINQNTLQTYRLLKD
jgi:hypothetical protein